MAVAAKKKGKRTVVLNMGPQHPATHGVLRVILELDGEIIVNAEPDIGYLHTGIEKLSEFHNYTQNITHYPRMDYLAPMNNELAYCLAVEKLIGLEVPKRARYIRVLMSELTRLNSHLIWLGTHALDIGAMTVFLYCFRERERILDMYEAIGGQRMMTTYFRIGGLAADIPDGFREMVTSFADDFPARLAEYEGLLTKNPIWLKRTQGIGKISAEEAVEFGLSGPVARASGVHWDIRKDTPYSSYEDFDFNAVFGTEGDVYERYLVRIEEMRQSLRIVRQAVDNMPDGDYSARDGKYVPPTRDRINASMEEVIHHFKIWTEGIKPPAGEAYAAVESGKGELGFYIVSDGSARAVRVKVRPPSFVNLSSLAKLCKGHLIADVVAIIGSLDIVLGEIDR